MRTYKGLRVSSENYYKLSLISDYYKSYLWVHLHTRIKKFGTAIMEENATPNFLGYFVVPLDPVIVSQTSEENKSNCSSVVL